jgi:hypothetical protein
MTHDKVSAHLHYSICRAEASKRQINGKHTPKPVCEHEDVTVLLNQGVHTDREIMANSPDIIIKNKKEKKFMQIEVTVPADGTPRTRKQKRN